MATRSPAPTLDPPDWFWGLIDDARGDASRLRVNLEALGRDGLALFYGYMRDLAAELTDDPYTSRLPPGISEERALDVGAWVVTQGRARYRETVRDPAAMPRDSFPGTPSERSMFGLPIRIHFEQFGESLPTDVEIRWRPDGSAEAQ